MSLDIRAPLGMTTQIPARRVARLRKDRIGAGLWLRRVEDKLRPAVFLRNRIKAGDGDQAEGLAIGRDAIAENQVVDGVAEQQNPEREHERNAHELFYKIPDFRVRGRGHGTSL
jgi:hypothetical protein